jgi:hypothetical protein
MDTGGPGASTQYEALLCTGLVIAVAKSGGTRRFLERWINLMRKVGETLEDVEEHYRRFRLDRQISGSAPERTCP